MGKFVKNVQATQGQTLEIPSVSTANRPAGQNGQIIFNTTTSTYQVYRGSLSTDWHNVSEASREKSILVDRCQGDGTTRTFGAGKGNTLDGSTAATLSVVPSDATDMVIFVGGIYQAPTINYTYSGGEITFGDAPPANDGTSSGHVITIIHNLQKLGQ